MRSIMTKSFVLICVFGFSAGQISATEFIDSLPYLDGVTGKDYLADTIVCAASSNIKAESSTWTDNRNRKEKKGLLFKLTTNGKSFFSFENKTKQISFNNNPDLTFTLNLISSTEPLDFYTGTPQKDELHRYFISHFKYKNLIVVSDTSGLAIEPFIMLNSNFAVYACTPYKGPK